MVLKGEPVEFLPSRLNSSFSLFPLSVGKVLSSDFSSWLMSVAMFLFALG